MDFVPSWFSMHLHTRPLLLLLFLLEEEYLPSLSEASGEANKIPTRVSDQE